ncbi:hypothetical protein BGZ74_001404 [Mortierella antarctica]|nr:hypothetical protein BGZ74_001404 [Mortierella antarctica]
MAFIYKLAIVATAALAMVSAAPVTAHHTTDTEIPASSESIITTAGTTYSGRGTWFTDSTGSCDISFNTNDMVVAMNAAMMGGTAQCGKTVRVEHGGKSVTARVTDTCPSQLCSSTSLDLSQAAFKQLAPLEAGEIDIQWSFV